MIIAFIAIFIEIPKPFRRFSHFIRVSPRHGYSATADNYYNPNTLSMHEGYQQF
jgi:hypothetical protein